MKFLEDFLYSITVGLLPSFASAIGRTRPAFKSHDQAKKVLQNPKTNPPLRTVKKIIPLWVIGGFIVLVGVGCAPKPTKVYESKQGFSQLIQQKTGKPINVTDDTVVVDARTRFDYTMAHYPGAEHLLWESFAQTKGRFPGRLIDDLESARKRLQLKGLHPNKPVIVIGYGSQGKGEAGRLAWTLFYLGFDDVQVVGDSVLKLSSNVVNAKPEPNAKPWPLKTRPRLISDKNEVLQAVTQQQAGPRKVFLFDVRSKDEYFKKEGLGQPYSLPDLGAIHVEWKEFFTEQGRPNLRIKKQLRGLGITEDSRIIVLSDQGVRSAAATAALVSLGFRNASNFVDGLNSLKK